jgi:formate dehydrogenase subunit gamma
MARWSFRLALGCAGVAAAVAWGAAFAVTGSPVLAMKGASAQQAAPGAGPEKAQIPVPDREMWRAIRRGQSGSITIPDKKEAVLVQHQGDNLRAFRNGPLSNFGGWLMLAAVVLCALFYAFRGRIAIEAGPSGRTVERFNAFERFTHWLTASSFIALALTGLNVLYGRYVLMPLIGQEAFAAITQWGKLAHNFLAFPFMLGVAIMFVVWVKDNVPGKADVEWLAAGGGLFTKGAHPPSRRFNAGQKLIFWVVVLGGLTLSISGLTLLFPYEINLWAPTFAVLNVLGFGLPTDLTPLQETQLSLVWHGLVALVLIAVIIGHIYIGTVGMEGAVGAVGTGHVDENWAREHHNLWYAELKGGAAGAAGARHQAAE